MDLMFCFCVEYQDEKSFKVISDIKKIAIHYLKGSCIYDLLACIPFAFLIGGDTHAKS